MTSRKGPSKSATLFKNGTIKVGNDGNKWVIITNKNDVKRWQKVKGASASVGAVTVKNKTKKSKQKSKRVLEMEADPETVWGKNKPLEEWWQSLASGKKVVLVEKNGEHKIFTMPTDKMTANKMYNTFDDDPNIVAVLSSNLSQDAYEVFLYPKAKDKSVKYVIKNYKKYFKSAGPMPADLVAKGIPAQKKVLFPA
jgi:predicted molibdopterin-dependent oxidoreductase YjgC